MIGYQDKKNDDDFYVSQLGWDEMIGYHHEKNDDDFYVLKMGRDGTRPPTR